LSNYYGTIFEFIYINAGSEYLSGFCNSLLLMLRYRLSLLYGIGYGGYGATSIASYEEESRYRLFLAALTLYYSFEKVVTGD